MPGQSGTVLSVKNVSGLLGGLLPMALGFLAESYGLGITMWLLLLGPIALLIGLPRRLDDGARGWARERGVQGRPCRGLGCPHCLSFL